MRALVRAGYAVPADAMSCAILAALLISPLQRRGWSGRLHLQLSRIVGCLRRWGASP